MNQPTHRNSKRPACATKPAASDIGVSITSERDARHRYQACTVSPSLKRGVVLPTPIQGADLRAQHESRLGCSSLLALEFNPLRTKGK